MKNDEAETMKTMKQWNNETMKQWKTVKQWNNETMKQWIPNNEKQSILCVVCSMVNGWPGWPGCSWLQTCFFFGRWLSWPWLHPAIPGCSLIVPGCPRLFLTASSWSLKKKECCLNAIVWRLRQLAFSIPHNLATSSNRCIALQGHCQPRYWIDKVDGIILAMDCATYFQWSLWKTREAEERSRKLREIRGWPGKFKEARRSLGRLLQTYKYSAWHVYRARSAHSACVKSATNFFRW